MNDANKTNNFLNAIKKYADQQKRDMQEEIEAFRAEEMKKAEEEGLKAAYELIQHELANKKSVITRDIAKAEKESLDKLFLKRKEMTQTVFDKAVAKLNDYTSTQTYSEKLIEQAKEISKTFGNKSCVIYLNKKDLNKSEEIQKLFDGETSVEASIDIKIGGIKAYCKELGVIADNTLDTELYNQKEWFLENSELHIM